MSCIFCVCVEMFSVAIQYFQQSAVMATEQSKYTSALKLSRKTENAVQRFYNQTTFDDDENARGRLSYHYRLLLFFRF